MVNLRAREIGKQHLEIVGSDVVLLDDDRLEYHSFSGRTFEVWSALDGATSRESLAAEIYADYGAAGPTMVDLAIDQLAGAGLLEGVTPPEPGVLNRRRALQIAAAGLIGAVGLPVVESITAPDSAAAVSRYGDREPTLQCGVGIGWCTTGCCCNTTTEAIQGICLTKSYCENYPAFCI